MPWGHQNHGYFVLWYKSHAMRITGGIQSTLGYLCGGAKSTRIFCMGVQNIGGYQILGVPIHCDTGIKPFPKN